MSEKRIPKRSEISSEFKWKLEDIYPTDEAFEKALADAGKYPELFAGYQGDYMPDEWDSGADVGREVIDG